MKNHFLLLVVSFFQMIYISDVVAQCDPTPTVNLQYVSGSGSSCVWRYTYSISYSGNSFKSFQFLHSCNGSAPAAITGCGSLAAPGITTGTTNTFICPCTPGANFQLTILYTTSNGSCGGGTQCTEPVYMVILPVSLSDVQIQEQNARACLQWNADNDTEASLYQVEYSLNGIDFSVVSDITPKHSVNRVKYSYCDPVLRSGGFYRIKVTDIQARVFYSSALKFTGNRTGEPVIFPNPVSDKINIVMPLTGVYNNATYIIYTQDGRYILSGRLSASYIDVSTTTAGLYQLVIKKDEVVIGRKIFLKQ